MNFVYVATLICTTLHIYLCNNKDYCHDNKPHAEVAACMKTEFGMSLGYLFVGIVNGWVTNRVDDDNCSSNYFYPLFVISYLSMIWSTNE